MDDATDLSDESIGSVHILLNARRLGIPTFSLLSCSLVQPAGLNSASCTRSKTASRRDVVRPRPSVRPVLNSIRSTVRQRNDDTISRGVYSGTYVCY